MSVVTADNAGTPQLKQFLMVNIKEFPRGINSDQVISKEPATAGNQRAPGPGLKLQATSSERFKLQAASIKPQAASIKRQAASNKLLDPGPFKKFQAPLIKGLYQDK